MIHHGDCLDVMASLDAESVDAIVTDPPYGIGFMGKAWDHGVAGIPFWEAALRVAKPSAYLLAFGGTRTYHRMTCAIEDAGWIIRDCLVWAYASGFPKSKASLKPAWEPIVMARKAGPLRDLAIDACRIPTEGRPHRIKTDDKGAEDAVVFAGRGSGWAVGETTEGRWPANVILTDPVFDGGIEGVVGGGETATATRQNDRWTRQSSIFGLGDAADTFYGDSSRFFLIPKAARDDREPVIGRGEDRANTHPTVKPTELMRHLVRLVTPAGGTVLDPFLGSGTTGLACELEGFPWVGIEREAEYVAIAEARLNGTQKGMGLSA